VNLSDLDYELPPSLVAQAPAEPRDSSRLLCLGRSNGVVSDRVFGDLPALLCPTDVLVRNDTRVLPARTFFRRPTGGRLEVLFLEARLDDDPEHKTWETLVRGRPRVGETLTNDTAGGEEWSLRVAAELGDGRWQVESLSELPVPALLARAGTMPLPPYIHAGLDDPERYQTVYARRPGSAAAPTAGLHFTAALEERLADAGVEVVDLTLHVGLGTFKPLSEEALAAGRLHSEPYVVERAAWRRLVAAKAAGRRLVAVGTTMVRLLESLARDEAATAAAAETREGDGSGASATDVTGDACLGGERFLCGRTDLFIRPGFDFRLVGGIVTNFHLPRTSLLALVMAFAGEAATRAAYVHAIAAGYRFYSLGDAMLVL
jgi:S-adenosylmethionine:tRNA ribosyltransferase-isomerase